MTNQPSMDTLELDLIEERETNWKYFSNPILSLTAILSLVINACLMAMLPEKILSWIVSLNFVILIAFIIARYFAYRRFSFIEDHEVIGSLLLKESSIEIIKKGSTTKTNLQHASLLLKYGSVRGTSHRERDAVNGISELQINKQSVKFIVHHFEEHEHLSALLGFWYGKGVELLEMTRDDNGYRLVKLELNFDWKEWEQIKANNEKKASTKAHLPSE